MLVPGEDRRAGFKPGLPQHSPACSHTSTALHASTAVPCHRLANSYLPLKACPSVASSGVVLTLVVPESPFSPYCKVSSTSFASVSGTTPLTPEDKLGYPVLAPLLPPYPLGLGAQEILGERSQGTRCSS